MYCYLLSKADGELLRGVEVFFTSRGFQVEVRHVRSADKLFGERIVRTVVGIGVFLQVR